ncbi:MAG: FAD-dependent oxidoreductase [Clostridia bacterium]|nr:FAD-dependent oxidoreductase [Clostridia bacterium]
MYDIIIIGAGPAGLSAAIYARRAAKSVLLLEANTYGGQIVNTPDIENYPVEEHISGFEFAMKLYTQATNLGAELKFERALSIETDGNKKIVKTAKNAYEAQAVIIATGAENRKLGVAREDDMVGKGVSYCATCDGAFYRGKAVAVVGGGNTAIDDAVYLADIAADVYLIHRREEFRADDATVQKLREKENVHFVLNSTVSTLVIENKVVGVEISDKEGNMQTLAVDCLFIAVGRIPENQAFADVLTLDAEGYALAGEDCITQAEGIFVAGDNRAKEVRQLVTATADGAVAATNAVKYINSLT